VLAEEFICRFGPDFLERYHRCWAASPFGLALKAVSPGQDPELLGVMLGALEPAAHYDWMLRHAGVGLARSMLAASLREPPLFKELLRTRAWRYSSAVAKRAGRRLTRFISPARPEQAPATRPGEVTHLMVSPKAQGQGVGRSLLAETERLAREHGNTHLVLVTPPESGARSFYHRLGWVEQEMATSKSGERFVRLVMEL